MLLCADVDRQKIPRQPLAMQNCSVIDLSHDGAIITVRGEKGGVSQQYSCRLDRSKPVWELRRSNFDERIDDVARPTSIRNRFEAVGVAGDGNLALRSRKNVFSLRRQLGMPVFATEPLGTSLRAAREFRPMKTQHPFRFQLSVATWPSGDRAILDSRGLLHLQPAVSNIPEVTLLLVEGELTGWCSDGRLFGKGYFLPEGEPPIRRAVPLRKIHEETITRFLESICAFD